MPLSKLTDVAFVELHVNVAAVPAETVVGLAATVKVGAAGGGDDCVLLELVEQAVRVAASISVAARLNIVVPVTSSKAKSSASRFSFSGSGDRIADRIQM